MKLFMFFPIFLFAFYTASLSLDLTTIECSGYGIDRENALKDAQKNTIQKIIKTMLTTQIELDSFKAKEKICLSKTLKELKNLQIISEEKKSDSLYEIKIKSDFSKTSVQKKLFSLQILVNAISKPRIMIIVSEENCGNWNNDNNIAENAINMFLSDPYNFDLINTGIVTSIKSSRQRTHQLINNISAAVSTGSQNGAEVLIIGTAISKKSDDDSKKLAGMVSVDAEITLKAINCTRGTLIGFEKNHALAKEMSYLEAGNIAIEIAAIKAVKNLLDPILRDWQGQLNAGTSINVFINNVNTYRQKNVIMHTFNRISNISLITEHIWDQKSATLEFTIDCKGNPNEFYKKIDGYKLVFGGGSLLVTGINKQKLTLVAQSL